MMSTSFSGGVQAVRSQGVSPFEYPDAEDVEEYALSPEPSSVAAAAAELGFARKAQISEAELASHVAQAQAEGLKEGEEKARSGFLKKLEEERARIAGALNDFKIERQKYYSRIEAEVVNLALAIAAKILHREAQVDPMLIAGLVRHTLEGLDRRTKALVRVHPSEASAWRRYFGEEEAAENITVMEDASVGPHGCVLDTELGVADFSLKAQLKEIERGFFDLLAHRPEPK
jgi:flagellar assembly protein FliH